MDAPPMPVPATTEPRQRPLLPPVLTGAPALLWLWVLPMVLLLALNLQGYALIEGNMNDAQRRDAYLLGAAGVLNIVAGLGLFFAARRQRESSWWGLPAVVVQAAYLWMAMSFMDNVVPPSVMQWIYPPQRYFYNQFAFAMLPLFWGLTRLACSKPQAAGRRSLLWSVGFALLAPVLLYGFFMILRRGNGWGEVGSVLLAIMVIVLGVLMFVGVIRGLAMGLRSLRAGQGTAERIAILVFALAMPLGGLLLNRSIPFPNDFQAWEVYALTVANAAVLLIASWQHERRPGLSLGLLCVTLPFTLYFFVVFLPFLPLSILGVIVMGAGFLVLTPTVLLVLHLSLLAKARRGFGARQWVTGALCFLLLPSFFTARGLADKAALNAALDHVYAPVLGESAITYQASRVNLKRALANHRSYKNGIYYPLLSDYYAWLVFDHLVLPDDKLARLETTFFGEPGTSENRDLVRSHRGDIFGGSRNSNRDRNRMPRAVPPSQMVTVTDLKLAVKPAAGEATTVTLALTLKNMDRADAEYIKKLPLPAGVFVSGFRLHINGEAVPGRITEKKTALWVYTMIRDSERRDPGLLFYNAPDELELRVFPVVASVPSIVEIDFLVPSALANPDELGRTFDPAVVLSRIENLLTPRISHDERGTVLAGGLSRLSLPATKREPYLHVIVDRSAANGFDGDIKGALQALRTKLPSAEIKRVTLANYEIKASDAGAPTLDALPLRGGFLADLVLAQAIRQHRDLDLDGAKANGPAGRPIFVILGKQAKALVVDDLKLTSEWADLLPRLEIYTAGAAGEWSTVVAPPEVDVPLLRLGDSMRPVVEGRPVRFTAAGNEARPEYWDMTAKHWRNIPGSPLSSVGETWSRAVGLQLAQQDYSREPGRADTALKTLVAESRESGVMLASTSYIVVENSAQWRMLDVAERQKLEQNAALSFKETPAPTWVWLSAGFGLWLAFRRWLKRWRMRAQC
ncbi:MAG: MSEP-CTERM sorting domain-containing protein [Rariglobus sp.]